MAATFLSHIKAPIPQPSDQFDYGRPAPPTKHPSLKSYSSSYGDSEATSTPKPPKTTRPYSIPGFISRPNSAFLSSNTPLAQVPQGSNMEDSADESDDVYDEFDLGDFTKEEVKAYESMVGPGERLRDAAPPEKSLGEMLEASYQANLPDSDKRTKGSPPVKTLPEELFDLVRAGITNGIEHAISRSYISAEFEDPDRLMYLVHVFMDEMYAPMPQVRRFIRGHAFTDHSSVTPKRLRRENMQDFWDPDSLTSAQSEYEQDVYNFCRNLGIPMDGAVQWVLEAREFFSEKDYEGTDTEDIDEDHDPYQMPDISRYRLPDDLYKYYSAIEKSTLPSVPIENSDQASHGNSPCSGAMSISGTQAPTFAGGSNSKSKDKIKDTIQLQQRQVQDSKHSRRRSEEGQSNAPTLTIPVLHDEPSVYSTVDQDGEIHRTELVPKEKKEQAVKKARKKKSKTEKGASRVLKEKYEHTAHPEGQVKPTNNPRELSQSEQLDDQTKPQLQKKKGRKRKRDRELQAQSEVPFGEIHNHKRIRIANDAQDVKSSKTKIKERGPQHSPFFQRSNNLKIKKKTSGTKAGQQMDF